MSIFTKSPCCFAVISAHFCECPLFVQQPAAQILRQDIQPRSSDSRQKSPCAGTLRQLRILRLVSRLIHLWQLLFLFVLQLLLGFASICKGEKPIFHLRFSSSEKSFFGQQKTPIKSGFLLGTFSYPPDGGGGWIRTIEVSDNRFTVCPLWPLGNSSIFGYVMRWWSWWTDSNPRPADYKSAALPAELHQHIRCDFITIPFGGCKVKP